MLGLKSWHSGNVCRFRGSMKASQDAGRQVSQWPIPTHQNQRLKVVARAGGRKRRGFMRGGTLATGHATAGPVTSSQAAAFVRTLRSRPCLCGGQLRAECQYSQASRQRADDCNTDQTGFIIHGVLRQRPIRLKVKCLFGMGQSQPLPANIGPFRLPGRNPSLVGTLFEPILSFARELSDYSAAGC